jgi:hypothetical protein
MRVLRFDREALTAGNPCVRVDDNPRLWEGFTITRGVLLIKAHNNDAYMEFHGDDPDITDLGHSLILAGRNADRIPFDRLCSPWPRAALEALKRDHTLRLGTISKYALSIDTPACLCFQANEYGVFGAERNLVRFEARPGHPIYSMVVNPPLLGRPEPYNCWVETTSPLVEY